MLSPLTKAESAARMAAAGRSTEYLIFALMLFLVAALLAQVTGVPPTILSAADIIASP